MAKVIMLVGLPGVGKSTWAKENVDAQSVHLSSDALRLELFGFEDQTKNHLLFRELNKRTVKMLEEGFNVIYDATNLNRKKRRHFINNVCRGYDVECVLFHATLGELLHRNVTRTERRLPELIIVEKMKSFQVPLISEGFKKISYVGNKTNKIMYGGKEYDILSMYENYFNYDQKTPYHTLTLGKHIEKVIENVEQLDCSTKDKMNLKIAAALHDLGKPLARIYDEETERAKYIGHENVSSYIMLPYLQPNTKNGELVHTMVSYHMRAHNIKTEKSKRKLQKEIGQEYYDLLMMFSKCDEEGK